MMEKKILDVTCGSRSIWFDKNHPAAIYCDKRDEEYTGVWKSTKRESERTCYVHPDIVCDFTALPFDDNSFALVVFDPPHLKRVSETAWLCKKIRQARRRLAADAPRWVPRVHAGSEAGRGTYLQVVGI